MARRTKIAENHYANPWAGPLALFPGWLIMVGLDLFVLLYILYHRKFPPSAIFLIIVFSYGLSALGGLTYTFFVESYQILLESDRIIGIGLFGQRKEIPYSDIEQIVEQNPLQLLGTKPRIYFISHTTPTLRIIVNGVLLEFGEMVEKVIRLSPDCTEISIDKLMVDRRSWQKAPDMELIHSAKVWAEENRKKREDIKPITQSESREAPCGMER